MGTELINGHRILAPLRSRWPWVVWGLIVQALGVGSVAVVMWHNVRDQSLGGHITVEMVSFAWHSELHNRAGLIVLAAGAVIYAGGSVVMARPYVSRPATLLIAVPVAAVIGMLLLGVLALAVAALFSAFANSVGDSHGGGGGSAGGGAEEKSVRRKDRQ
ncbi:MAG: hypothetical protein ACRDOK_12220 [Streptosporangiaceae bacterium]